MKSFLYIKISKEKFLNFKCVVKVAKQVSDGIKVAQCKV